MNNEISKDVDKRRLIQFNGNSWVVLSGGNFHGECCVSVADSLNIANAKIALTMERQLIYLLNPDRNKKLLPAYLIANTKKMGLQSGYMITQYTANALAQKNCQLATPVSNFNLTSGNESEDVVSYGASAAQKLLVQLDLLHQLNTVYLTTVSQAYSLHRQGYQPNENLTSEKIFLEVQKQVGNIFSTLNDVAFDNIYDNINFFLNSSNLREIIMFPIQKDIDLILQYGLSYNRKGID